MSNTNIFFFLQKAIDESVDFIFEKVFLLEDQPLMQKQETSINNFTEGSIQNLNFTETIIYNNEDLEKTKNQEIFFEKNYLDTNHFEKLHTNDQDYNIFSRLSSMNKINEKKNTSTKNLSYKDNYFFLEKSQKNQSEKFTGKTLELQDSDELNLKHTNSYDVIQYKSEAIKNEDKISSFNDQMIIYNKVNKNLGIADKNLEYDYLNEKNNYLEDYQNINIKNSLDTSKNGEKSAKNNFMNNILNKNKKRIFIRENSNKKTNFDYGSMELNESELFEMKSDDLNNIENEMNNVDEEFFKKNIENKKKKSGNFRALNK